ncbi:hypothetical protein D1872_195920 [compost metagenome]
MTKIQCRLHVTAEWITDYLKSIEAPMQTKNDLLIAPATMPVLFWQYFDIPWLKRDTAMFHGSQSFSYDEPIVEGMILNCELSLLKIEKKTGRQGEMTLYTHSLVCKCRGKRIVTAETVLIQIGDGS